VLDDVEGARRKWHRSRVAVLCASQEYRASPEVNIVPSHGQQFAPAHSCLYGQLDDCREPMATCRFTGGEQTLKFVCRRAAFPWTAGAGQLDLTDWVRRKHETPFVPGHLKAMTDYGQLATHRVATDHCQPIIAILGDLSRSQSVER